MNNHSMGDDILLLQVSSEHANSAVRNGIHLICSEQARSTGCIILLIEEDERILARVSVSRRRQRSSWILQM